MSLEQILYTKLAGTSAINDAVDGRIYPNKAPQDTPNRYIVYKLIDSVEVHAMQTSSGTGDARFQVDYYSDDYDDAVAMRKIIRQTLTRWPRSEVVAPVDGVTVKDCIILSAQMIYEDAIEKDRVIVDLNIKYREV